MTIQNIILGSLKKNVFVSVKEGICAQECKSPQRPKKEGVDPLELELQEDES